MEKQWYRQTMAILKLLTGDVGDDYQWLLIPQRDRQAFSASPWKAIYERVTQK